MDDALVSSASGMNVYERKLDVATRNLANARLPGYVPRTVATHTFGASMDDALSAGHVMPVDGLSFAQGELVPSSNPLAAGLGSEGFFVLDTPDGPAYTRGGEFAVMNGQFTSRGGYVVQGDGGPIALDPAGPTPTIDTGGNVHQGGIPVGRIKVVNFADTSKLEAVGETLLRPKEGSNAEPEDVLAPVFAPGLVEVPAAAGVSGLVDLVAIHRGYESAQRAAVAIHESYERALRS